MTRTRGARRAAHLVATLLLAGAAAGCAVPSSLKGLPDGGGSVAVMPERAIVRLPAAWADRRLAVRREMVLNRMVERVVLANDTALPFENRIEARTAWRGVEGSPFLREIPEGPFTTEDVAALAERQFPGATTISAPTEATNRKGPYAYLRAAYADGPACVYAWQVVDSFASSDRRAHGLAVDLRYCGSVAGDAGGDHADEALALFDSVEFRLEY